MRKKRKEHRNRLIIFASAILTLVLAMLVMAAPELIASIADMSIMDGVTQMQIGGVGIAALPLIWLKDDGTFKELSPEEVSKLDTEDQIKYFNALNEHKATQMKKLKEELKNNASTEIKNQIETLKAEINKDNKEQLQLLKNAIQKQGEAMTKLMAKGGSDEKKETLLSQIKSVSEGIKKAVNKAVKEYEFTVKANATRASVASSTQAMRLTDIGQLSHRRLSARDVFQVVPVDAASNGVVRYADWDAATTARAAAMVAEGASFPESTAAWEEFKLDLKKVGDTIPVTEEMVMDAPRFAAELDMFIKTNIAIIEDAQLISGDGTGNNLNGVYPTAPTYTPVASGISDASIYDLLVVMKAEITGTHGAKYDPDFVFMNTSDITKMQLKKDVNENYIIPPFVDRDGKVVNGAVVIENNSIAADTLVMGDSRYGKIYMLEGVTVSTGYTGDQFSDDLMTMKARQRENLLIRNVDQTGFLKCTGITAALVTLAT